MLKLLRVNKNVKQQTDTIIVNGKHFNAHSGQPVLVKAASKAVKNVDGILPQHVTAGVLEKAPRYTRQITAVTKQPVMDIARSGVHHMTKHPVQPAKTLMRRSLSKPTPGLKRRTKLVAAHQQSAVVAIANVTPKTSAATVNSQKLKKSLTVSKSNLITRFSTETSSFSHQPRLSNTASSAIVASQNAAHGLAKQPSMDIFELALARANGHQQKTPPHVTKTLKKSNKASRRLTWATASLAIVVLVGLIAYQNIPKLKFQYASSQAGFHAVLPGYRPSGFSLAKLSYQAGAVSVNFHSNSDDRAFAIVQKTSAWDSQTLRDNFVAAVGQQYHTAVAAGRTIYLYGDNNATWVNGGVWYQVQAKAGSLNERQLTQLATSM